MLLLDLSWRFARRAEDLASQVQQRHERLLGAVVGVYQAAVRHNGRGCLVDQIAPGDRFHERLAQRRLVEVTEPGGLDLFVPLFAPVPAVDCPAQ